MYSIVMKIPLYATTKDNIRKPLNREQAVAVLDDFFEHFEEIDGYAVNDIYLETVKKEEVK